MLSFVSVVVFLFVVFSFFDFLVYFLIAQKLMIRHNCVQLCELLIAV